MEPTSVKLNIYVSDQEKLDGDQYFNFALNDFNELDSFIDDGECDEIRLNSSLALIMLSEIDMFFDKIMQKLAFDGTVNASALDIIEICRDVNYRNLSSNTDDDQIVIINKILFGDPRVKNVLSLEYLVDLFTKHNLTITKKKVANYASHVAGKLSVQPN